MSNQLRAAVRAFAIARSDLRNAQDNHLLMMRARHFSSNELAASSNRVKELEDLHWSTGTELLLILDPEAGGPCL